MTRFASIDPDVHAVYRKMVNDFLIKAMQERMWGLIFRKCVLGLLGGKANQYKTFTVKDFGEMQR